MVLVLLCWGLGDMNAQLLLVPHAYAEKTVFRQI
jgi:hypothetical protein